MRLFLVSIFLILVSINISSTTLSMEEKESIIIEVDGNPEEHVKYIETYHPYVEVITTYEKLFNGLALQGTLEKLAKLSSAEFIKAFHPVRTYEAIELKSDNHNVVFPDTLNTTPYTGEGVKVAVIDTGIDYTHPDLVKNYAGGYDLVDFDDDPMETTPEDGIATSHGTHVAGIIAANGHLTGVAKDAEIHGYRALGSGGTGTSIQVIAAMEQAVNDGVDIINLSLGNSVNGPDFPTSQAVNKAVDLDVAVVIANGNDGPGDWTVGSPATATNALSVGALMSEQQIPSLYDPQHDKKTPLTLMQGSLLWDLKKDYQLIDMDEEDNQLSGKIAITTRDDTPFVDKAVQAEKNGAVALLIYNNEEDDFHGSIESDAESINIPVAAISMDDGLWLLGQQDEKPYYIDTLYEKLSEGVAPFSSRGPVTNSWQIKPDILAPGANILSTVPEGYEALHGTSMAAPHVAGAIAVIKEANPHWSNEQIIRAMKTTAKRVTTDDGTLVSPTAQGIGEIQIQESIQTTTFIDEPLLSFGKVNEFKETTTIERTIENTANKEKKYSFTIPTKQPGLSWDLPQTITVDANSSKTIEIDLAITTPLIEEGIHEGWITLSEQDQIYELPYVFVNQAANYPKAMGFDLSLKAFSDDTYQYQIYATEPITRMDIQLFNHDSLFYERKFLHVQDLEAGLNEGEIDKSLVGEPGLYQALITVQLASGDVESYELELFIH